MKSYGYMAFGITIAVIARLFMRAGSNTAFYNLVFYIGVVAFAFGLVKIFFERTEKMDEEQKASEPKRHREGSHITYCEKCNTKNHTISNYCHMCGHKLKEAGKAILRNS